MENFTAVKLLQGSLHKANKNKILIFAGSSFLFFFHIFVMSFT